ncbi:hypothetical protein GYMLUDRAFT_178097, partial [Collybiopsis luxurians FD-317 M1]
PNISLGTVTGCTLITFHNQKNHLLPQAQRLFTILVSESAHLIWKIRCEAVIHKEGRNPSVQEVYNRFKFLLNAYLQKDICQSNSYRWGQHTIPMSTVKQTWTPLICTPHYEDPPPDWVGKSKVLVGIEPPTHFIVPGSQVT